MSKTDKKTKEKAKQFNRLKLYLGYGLLVFMFIVYVFFDKFDVWLFAFPAFLLGLDPKDVFKK